MPPVEFFDTLSVEQLRTMRDCVAVCGCICHVHDCTHFRACCDFSYVKLETVEALIAARVDEAFAARWSPE